MDSNGKQKLDAKDRPLWRIGKHPITTFPAEIERYGIDAVLGANDKMLEVIRFSDRPMEKVFDEAEKSGMTVSAEVVLTADSWRNYLLAHLGCSARVSKALETAGLKTLGELTNFQAKHGDFWIKDIKGLGATGSEELTNRLESFWTEHPEYCQAQSEEK